VRRLSRAVPTAVPASPLLAAALPRVDFADAHAVAVEPGTPTDPQAWVDAVFFDPPGWVAALLWLRNAVVRLVGIAPGDRTSFRTLAHTADEVLLGTDECHLDFRAVVRREPGRVVLSTVVRLHNRRPGLLRAGPPRAPAGGAGDAGPGGAPVVGFLQSGRRHGGQDGPMRWWPWTS
jgi:hypothetical protein